MGQNCFSQTKPADIKDVFRQPYTLHVLDLPCPQLSLKECSSLNATRWNSNLAVTPTELIPGLLASTTTNELQPPKSHQASQSSMCTAKKQLNSCTPKVQWGLPHSASTCMYSCFITSDTGHSYSVKTVTASYKRCLQGLFAQYVWDLHIPCQFTVQCTLLCGSYIIVAK